MTFPKSREIKLKSPDRKYEVRDDCERRIYNWSIKNFVPDRKTRAEEEDEKLHVGPRNRELS